MKQNNIIIRNVFHMLSYAYKELNQTIYKKVAIEDFDNMDNLFAKIIQAGITRQIKRGLYREYVVKSEDAYTLRGKLLVGGTINNRIRQSNALHMEYEDLTENNTLNQILKSTMIILIKNVALDNEMRINLKRNLLYFNHIESIDLRFIQWHSIVFNRQNETYRLLLNICRFIIERHLIKENDGEFAAITFDDDNVARIFERFVLEFCKIRFPELLPARPEIKWHIKEERSEGLDFLPRMRTDVVLYGIETDLIIDTKFYNSIYQKNFGTVKHRSSHLYQMHSYIMNYKMATNKKVTGMLLYAQTDNERVPRSSYELNGAQLLVNSVNLNSKIHELEQAIQTLIEDNTH